MLKPMFAAAASLSAAVLLHHTSHADGEELVRVASSLRLATARKIADGALSEGRTHSMHPLAVVVLDSGGHVVVSMREDGCGVLRSDIALAKAYGSLSMGMSTRQLRDRLAGRPYFLASLVATSEGRMAPAPGGVLVLDQGNIAIGAVGVSGDTSERDEFVAITAVHAAGLRSAPGEPAEGWQSSSLSGHR